MSWRFEALLRQRAKRGVALAVIGLWFCAQPALAESTPRLRWQETVDVDGEADFATAVLVQRNRVLLGVRGQLARKPDDRRRKHENFVIAYSPSNGEELWRRRYANDRPQALIPAGRRTVVTLRAPTELDVIHAKTGVSLWSWMEDRPGQREAPLARATQSTLYTAAVLPSADRLFNGRILIQARSLASGQLLWEVWEPWSGIGPASGSSDRILDLAPNADRLFAVGVRGEGAGKKEQRFVKAYDSMSGDELWSENLPFPEFSRVLGAHGGVVLLAGNRRGGERGDQRTRLVVRALDQATGEELWQVERGDAHKDRGYYPEGVLAKDDLMIVVGCWSESRTPFNRSVFAYAFDRSTGALAWEREVPYSAGTPFGLRSAELAGGALLIAHQSEREVDLLALTPQRGKTLWEISSPHIFSSLATQARKRLFVAGAIDGGSSGFDGALSAYKLPPR